jgi:hypothetical protein
MVLEDNQKIGVGLICLGMGFIFLGIILFFDSSLIAIGNILFLVGLCFSIGFKRALSLFTRKDRIRGTVCFILGIVLVMCRWGLVGMLVEGFGFLNLFGNFLPTVVAVGRQVPGLGKVLELPIIAQAADFIAGKSAMKLPKYGV